jgi:hypothetical protein
MVRQRKEKWRKVAPEVDRALEKRAAEAALQDREDLFTVDTTGSLAGLSRSVRKAITKDPTGSGKKPLSRQEKAKVARAARSKPMPKKVEPEVFDAWAPEPEVKTKFAYDEVRRIEDELKVGRGRSGFDPTSKAPPIMPPEAGHSVNPSAEAIETVFARAAAVEFEKERENELRNRRARPVTSALLEEFEPEELAKMTDAEKQAHYLKRVRTDETKDGEIELPVKKATSKKTRAQINKELRRQAQEAEETRARKQKKLDKSVGEVGAILKGFKAKDSERAAQKAYAADAKAKEEEDVRSGRITKVPRVGKNKYEEAPLEVVYDADERRTLRSATKVSAIRTCADSYYRRNMLEARPENSRANARFLQKRVRKANNSNRFVAKEYRDKSLLL